MSPSAVTWIRADWALFLDVDGTLLDIAETPQSVQVSEKIKKLLVRLSMHLDGAVALVSGRCLQDLDRLFAPLRPCASGGHGCERRDARGCVSRISPDRRQFEFARSELSTFVNSHPGLLLEDKGFGLAVHFRRVPDLAADVRNAMTPIRERLGSDFVLQPGKCVLELRPASCSKGASISEFMREPPFLGRTPVFAGDDVTDEEGFAVVNALGGVSICVGEPPTTIAQHRLRGVNEVIQWLDRVPSLSGFSI